MFGYNAPKVTVLVPGLACTCLIYVESNLNADQIPIDIDQSRLWADGMGNSCCPTLRDRAVKSPDDPTRRSEPAGWTASTMLDFQSKRRPDKVRLVPEAGLEPAHLAAGDFESPASTIPPLGHADASNPHCRGGQE